MIQTECSISERTIRKNNSRVFLFQVINVDISSISLVNLRHFKVRAALIDRSDPNIAEELAAVSVVLKHLHKVILNLLHGLVVRGDACTNEPVWMGVAVKNVDPAVLNRSQQHLSHVEARGPAADYGEP